MYYVMEKELKHYLTFLSVSKGEWDCVYTDVLEDATKFETLTDLVSMVESLKDFCGELSIESTSDKAHIRSCVMCLDV